MTTGMQEVRNEVASIGGKLDNLEKSFTDLTEKVVQFIDQYELDMRGNKDINGKKGIVNEIREIKQHLKDNPSLLWLLKNKTLRTILVIAGIGLSIYFVGNVLFFTFGSVALVEAFLKLLGIPLL